MHLTLFRLNMIFQVRSGGSLGNRTQRKEWLKEELGQRISSAMRMKNASCLDMGQSHKKVPQDELECSEEWIQRDFRQPEKGWGQHGLCVVVLLTQPCMNTCALHTRVTELLMLLTILALWSTVNKTDMASGFLDLGGYWGKVDKLNNQTETYRLWKYCEGNEHRLWEW